MMMMIMAMANVTITAKLMQGPKLTFLGRRQVATEIFFFSVTKWKNVVAKKQGKKVSIKFFLRSETQTKIIGCQMENSGRQFFF